MLLVRYSAEDIRQIIRDQLEAKDDKVLSFGDDVQMFVFG